MEKYILKSALVAEIEKRINKEIQSCATDNCFGYSQGCVDSMRNILSFLNTLEVKEVDLEEEIKSFTMSKELYEADSAIKAVAEHFFELGINAEEDKLWEK